MFITNSNSQNFIKYQKNQLIPRRVDELMNQLRFKDPQCHFYPLEDNDLNEERYLIVEGKEFSSEDGYTIQKMDYDYKYNCLLVRSMLPVFQSFTHSLRHKPSEEIRNETFNRIQKTLRNLISFVFAKDSNEEVDYFKISEDPLQER